MQKHSVAVFHLNKISSKKEKSELSNGKEMQNELTFV